MANDTTFLDATNVVKDLRAEDVGGGVLMEIAKTAPLVATPVAGAQTLTVLNSSVTKSGAGITIPSGATHCLISVEGNSIRFLRETVTTTKGHLLAPGAGPLELDNLTLLQMIAVSGAASVQISYHKYV